jgi:hypothetical protein
MLQLVNDKVTKVLEKTYEQITKAIRASEILG